jgi:hypothetical protein
MDCYKKTLSLLDDHALDGGLHTSMLKLVLYFMAAGREPVRRRTPRNQ